MIQRVRISAISDMKEFSGKNQDQDLARAWLTSDEEKCLTFADLLAGFAKNWYQQLSRSTRNKWSDLLRSFPIQYCRLGELVARPSFHARRRSDESPLDYLYRLNVAELRARLKIKDESTKDRREHGDHFIEILEDPNLADRLTLPRLSDADDLKEKKAAFGSGKFQPKASNAASSAPTKQVRATQIQAVDSGSDTSHGSDGSDSEMDRHRQIYLPANQEVVPKEEGETIMPDTGHQDSVP
ncbi:hypothetical protein PHMEG_00020780 [Phytophthora megakarya]|uniref:Retrotransposon gag domain-containing protein n=1 Tax=Phytophthora megakarya TaxID=4795 RepID=A0A225VPF2_9STRA|nr:hypothetical protein PHMEG_00020780 [Phytophthora megakarya]